MLKCEKGQSTVEFLVTFPFVFLFIVFFFKLALNFTKGYLAHYATFTAGRSFLVFDYHEPDDSKARSSAREVFDSILLSNINASQFNVRGLKFNYFSDVTDGNNTNPLFKGAYFDYKETFSLSRLLGGKNPMNLRSEALLGREPTRIGCLRRICKAMEQLAGVSSCKKDNGLVTLSDNGC